MIASRPPSIEVAKPRPLFDSEYINFGHPSNYHTFAVSPDGQRFLIPRPEPDTLVVLDREGRSRTLDTDNWGDPHDSPDGKRVAAIRGNRSVWVMDIAGGARRQVGKLNGPQDFAVSVAWSRDGQQVAFIALDLAIGKDVLYLANANGGAEAKQLRTFEGVAGQLRQEPPVDLEVEADRVTAVGEQRDGHACAWIAGAGHDAQEGASHRLEWLRREA